jgi:peptidoglycan/LPS O-acetylase OafA/YrhL
MRDPGSDIGRYLGGLDGLRGVACLTVLAAHCVGHFAPTVTPNGVPQILAQGMTIFFVLSGMLIYLPFVRAMSAGTTVPTGRYARRRLMRIFPAYVAIFLVCDLVLGAVYVRNAVESATPLRDVGTGRMLAPGDLALHLSLLQTFVPEQMQTGIPPAWSLTTELTFYAVLPPLAWLAVTCAGRRNRAALIPPLVLFVVGIVGRLLVTHRFAASGLSVVEAEFGPNGVAVLARSLAVFADTFAVGMVVAVLFAGTETGRWPRWSARRAGAVGWVLLAAGATGGLLLLNVQHWFVGSLTGIAAAGLLLLVADPTARGSATWVSRLAGLAPLRHVGECSYSVYLWHVPVIVLVARAGWFHSDSLATLTGATALVALLSIALASVTFRWIERPAMEWASTYPVRARPGATAHGSRPA